SARSPPCATLFPYTTLFRSGVDNIDLGAAASRGIEVVNAPGMNYHAVADLVLGMILSLLRGLPSADASVRAGEWETFHGPEVRRSEAHTSELQSRFDLVCRL